MSVYLFIKQSIHILSILQLFAYRLVIIDIVEKIVVNIKGRLTLLSTGDEELSRRPVINVVVSKTLSR